MTTRNLIKHKYRVKCQKCGEYYLIYESERDSDKRICEVCKRGNGMVLTEQQSSVIEYIAASHLKPSQFSLDIYGDDGFHDLVDSIKELGIIQALYVNNHNEIISGHRRWMAARTIDTEFMCPVIRKKYTNEIDEKQAIIEFNRYRVKSGLQLFNELTALQGIRKQLEEKAKLNSYSNLKQYINETDNRSKPEWERFPIREPKRVKQELADAIGIGSYKQLDKLEYVAQHKPDLLPQIKPHGITINSAFNETRKEVIKATAPEPPPMPQGLFNVVYADPPWKYEFSEAYNREIEKQYATMSLDEIKYKYTIPTAEDCVLLLWATAPKLQEALEVMKAWGFTYKTCAVWDKEIIGMGYWFRGQHELLLLGTKGSPKVPEPENRVSSVIRERRTEHSVKPKLYEVIEKMFPSANYLELFSRDSNREKWTMWGNNADTRL